MSSTNGVVIFPSGRTGRLADNSGLCQTVILSVSPAPIR
jgi:hypothetical protein